MVGIINLGLGTSMSHFETRYDSEPLLFDAEGRRIVMTIPEWDGNKVLPPIHPATPEGQEHDSLYRAPYVARLAEFVTQFATTRDRVDLTGNYLNLREAWVDCDGDTILLKVQPDGPACHTGETSCFFTPMDELPDEYESAETWPRILDELFAVIKDRQQELPEDSYTAKLLQQGVPRVAQKVIEEAGEAAIAATQGDIDNLPGEVADLLYHSLVLLAAAGLSPQAVWEELRTRRG